MNDKLKQELIYIIAFLLFVAFVGFDIKNGKDIPDTRAMEVLQTPKPTLEPTPEPQIEEIKKDYTIEEYIKVKFEDDADKAFLLLKGNDKCGGENPRLNPKAVNVNRDGSRDRGIFQINDKYHPLTDEQAFDWKTNTDYAFRMFENDNRTFIRWTAGRCMGI